MTASYPQPPRCLFSEKDHFDLVRESTSIYKNSDRMDQGALGVCYPEPLGDQDHGVQRVEAMGSNGSRSWGPSRHFAQTYQARVGQRTCRSSSLAEDMKRAKTRTSC